jgi:hypothetical protein
LVYSTEADHDKQEGKIKVAEEELGKIVPAKELEFQAPPGHELMWNNFILDRSFDGQNEV